MAGGYKYRALRDLWFNGVRAQSAGGLVHESAVEGDGAWLTLGDDVEPVEGAPLNKPPLNASQAQWASFAISQGADPDEAIGQSRAGLITEYGGG